MDRKELILRTEPVDVRHLRRVGGGVEWRFGGAEVADPVLVQAALEIRMRKCESDREAFRFFWFQHVSRPAPTFRRLPRRESAGWKGVILRLARHRHRRNPA